MSVLFIILGVVALSILVFLVNLKFFGMEVLESNSHLADKYLMITTAVYGVFLAFAILSLWESLDHASDLADSEASELVYLYRLSDLVPPPAGERLRQGVLAYTKFVIEKEWPAMQVNAGRALMTTRTPKRDLVAICLHLPAQTDTDRDTRDQILESLRIITNSSRERILLSQRHLAPFVQAVIWLGGFATVIPLTLIATKNRFFQLTSKVCTIGLLASMICLVFDLQSQYSGPTRLTPESYRVALIQMQIRE